MGRSLDCSPIDPFKALFWSAVINALMAAPLIVVIILLAINNKDMGAFTASRSLAVMGCIGAAVMFAAAARMLCPG